VWFVGGTPDIVAGVYLGYDTPKPLGAYAQGGRIAAPVWKQWAQTALKDQSRVPFVAPPGIRWVRIDRATGKRVFGVFPTTEDPKSSVIWEAFQPQTEPRRSFRGVAGDPYDQQNPDQAQQPNRQPLPRPGAAGPAVVRPRPAPATPPAGLPTQNGV
jgi:penicillin-binding protein 1A